MKRQVERTTKSNTGYPTSGLTIAWHMLGKDTFMDKDQILNTFPTQYFFNDQYFSENRT